jgi:hypothetical protein
MWYSAFEDESGPKNEPEKVRQWLILSKSPPSHHLAPPSTAKRTPYITMVSDRHSFNLADCPRALNASFSIPHHECVNVKIPMPQCQLSLPTTRF